MEKPGHLLGADSSSEQFLHEGKEGVERGTDVCTGSRWAWAMCSCPKRGESQTTAPPGIPPPSLGTALNTKVWGVSPHLDASSRALPLPSPAQLLQGSRVSCPKQITGWLVEDGLGLEHGPCTPPLSDTQCRERAFSQGRARHRSTGLLLPCIQHQRCNRFHLPLDRGWHLCIYRQLPPPRTAASSSTTQ